MYDCNTQEKLIKFYHETMLIPVKKDADRSSKMQIPLRVARVHANGYEEKPKGIRSNSSRAFEP
eukprot:449041-Ditylum_brightwellii.AAC.1